MVYVDSAGVDWLMEGTILVAGLDLGRLIENLHPCVSSVLMLTPSDPPGRFPRPGVAVPSRWSALRPP